MEKMSTPQSPNQAPPDTSKASKASPMKAPPTKAPPTKAQIDPKHKNMHPETVIPAPHLRERPDVLPSTRVDDDPESYRLT